MKFIYSYNTRENERREGQTISAPNRDAAFSELNRRGIRPYKLYPAPGLWNKVLSIGWRGFVIILLAAILVLSVAIALNQHKDIVKLEQDDDVREIVSGAITSKVRRQLIGRFCKAGTHNCIVLGDFAGFFSKFEKYTARQTSPPLRKP